MAGCARYFMGIGARQALAEVILGRRPPLMPRARAEASPARVRSRDQFVLVLGQGREDSEDEATSGRCSIDAGSLAGEDTESDLSFVEVFDDLYQVLEAAAEAIKLPDDEVSSDWRALRLAAKSGRLSFRPEARFS